MKVKQVIEKYHALVNFPWSVDKISKAGYDPSTFTANIIRQLENCEDSENPDYAEILNELRNLQD